MRFSFPRFLKPFLAGLLAVYLAGCGVMWTVQRDFLFFPDRDLGTPASYGLADFSAHTIAAADGIKLMTWYHPAKSGFPLVVYFHSNGGHLGTRADFLGRMAKRGFGVLALSYRGYGTSEGEPSEQGFYQDARATLAYARDDLQTAPGAIVLFGESMGTGVATQMATEFPVAALVLKSPYSSMIEMGEDRFPWLPVRLLIRDRFDSISKIGGLRMPLLMFHGELDAVVPVDSGRRLFAAAPEPKEAFYFPQVAHMDFDDDKIIDLLVTFCRKHGLLAKVAEAQPSYSAGGVRSQRASWAG